jgi:hypothetical protein
MIRLLMIRFLTIGLVKIIVSHCHSDPRPAAAGIPARLLAPRARTARAAQMLPARVRAALARA